MTDAINTALSGLLAQGKRLSATASNIANVSTSGRVPTADNPSSSVYKPLEVNLTSSSVNGEGAGVKAEIIQRDSYVKAYSPNSSYADENGMIATPDISLESELVTMMTAKLAYKANIKTIQAQEEMIGELLDSIT